MKSPSPKCYITIWDMSIYSDTPQLSDILLISKQDFIADFDLITKFREVSIKYLQRVWLVNKGRLLIRTPGPVPFKTGIFCHVETYLLKNCHISGIEFRTSLGTSVLLWSHPGYA